MDIIIYASCLEKNIPPQDGEVLWDKDDQVCQDAQGVELAHGEATVTTVEAGFRGAGLDMVLATPPGGIAKGSSGADDPLGQKSSSSQRPLRLASVLRKELGRLLPQILEKSKTPLAAIISHVKMNNRLSNGVIFLEGDDKASAAKFCNTMVPALRHELAKVMRVRFLPQLRFVADDHWQRRKGLMDLLDAVKADVAKED